MERIRAFHRASSEEQRSYRLESTLRHHWGDSKTLGRSFRLSYFLKPLRGDGWSWPVHISHIPHKKPPSVWGVASSTPGTLSHVGASVLLRRPALAPPPRRERVGPRCVLALLTRLESRNTTMTVMSSWKWRRTPRSIFLRSEYLISLFLAASCSAAVISLLAQPCKIKQRCEA